MEFYSPCLTFVESYFKRGGASCVLRRAHYFEASINERLVGSSTYISGESALGQLTRHFHFHLFSLCTFIFKSKKKGMNNENSLKCMKN